MRIIGDGNSRQEEPEAPATKEPFRETYGEAGEPQVPVTEESFREADGETESQVDTLQLYLDELQGLPSLGADETEELLRKAHDGDRRSRDRLTEGNLKYAMSLVSGFTGGSLSVPDLISEANLALVSAVNGCAAAGSLPAELKAAIERGVTDALKSAEAAKKAENEADTGIAQKINMFTELTRVMAEELGRQATVEELSVRMHADPEEVREIIKMAKQAMET